MSIAIVVLLVILTLSYEQTIHAYPGGGGAYIVSRDNLGELPAADRRRGPADRLHPDGRRIDLLRRRQIASAFPASTRTGWRLSVGLVLFVMVVNLRGVKESGTLFAVPTYFFLVMVFLTVGVGVGPLFDRHAGHGGQPASAGLIVWHPGAVTLFLILRAFASGTTALTGVEAISNGITAFKEPRSHNAGITLIWMSVILGTLLLGITFLAVQIGAVPSEQETVISQLGRVRSSAMPGWHVLYLA